MHFTNVACGMGRSMVIVDRTNVGDRLDQLDIYDDNDDKTRADHYFDSYSRFGAHENKDARAGTSYLSLCCAKVEAISV